MKKLYSLIVNLLLATSLFAAQGLLWGKAPLRTVSTKWFDIIYSEDSSNTAQKLYENADSIYEEVAELYGYPPYYRMPVVLTADVEIYNAYWSSGYYNHIVLYDTAISQDMAVFSDDILSTFRHEVTHAYTYNLKDGFWKYLTKIMGDSITGAGLTVTSGLAEGATLTSESANGEGRLNSEYAKQMVRQAKIENKFPNYYEMQGEADRLPSGSFYYFNGAFDEYLQKTYGMKRYARFWFVLVNGKYFSADTAFKKVYGIKLREAWNSFLSKYYIPEVEENPVKANLVQDFFIPAVNQYSKENQRGNRFGSLSACQTGLFYLNEKTSSIYFVSNQQLENGKITPQKILSLNNLIEFKPSADGRFIALTYYDINSPNIKIKAAVYDVQQKDLFKLPGTGVSNVSVISKENDYFVTGLKFHSQDKALEIFKLDLQKNKIKACTSLCKIPLPENTSASNFTDIGNGQFAFIVREKLNFKICTATVEGTLLKEYVLSQEKMELRDLSYNSETKELAFSYTTKDQMPQLGKLSIENDKLSFWKQNLSGGVYQPVIYKNNLYYAGNFYLQDRLFVKPAQEIPYSEEQINAVAFALVPEEKPVEDTLPYSKYQGSKYLFKGLFLPVSTATSVSYDPYHYGGALLPWGITFIRSNPWDSNQMQFSAGYGFVPQSFGLDFQFASGTSTSLFNYGFGTALEFDKLGFKQTTEQLSLNSGFYVGNHSSLYLGNYSIFHYGRSGATTASIYAMLLELFWGTYSVPDESINYLYGANQTQITYANAIKTGPGKYEKLGFSATAMLAWIYNAQAGNTPVIYQNGGDLGFAARFYIPKLLPINNQQGIITNLPSKLSVNLFLKPEQEEKITIFENFGHSKEDFPSFNLGSVSFDTILFQKDIQKTIPFLSALFINDFQVSFTYLAGVNSNDTVPTTEAWKIAKLDKYIEMIGKGSLPVVSVPYVKLTLGVTPSFGGLANTEYKTLICFRAGCAIKEEKVIPVFGFALDFNY